MMKVPKWAVVLLMAILGLMAGVPALASPTPDTQADVTYLQLLDENGMSQPQRNSQHGMGVIIAAAVVAYRPSLTPVVRHWADSAAGFSCAAAAEGVLR